MQGCVIIERRGSLVGDPEGMHFSPSLICTRTPPRYYIYVDIFCGEAGNWRGGMGFCLMSKEGLGRCHGITGDCV